MIRELEQSVRALSEQIKFLSINSVTPLQQPLVRNSPGPVAGGSSMVPFSQQQSFRHVGPPVNVPQMYGPPPQPHSQQPGMQGPWFPSGIPAPQASHPTLPPPTQQTPPAPSEEMWDDTYLAVLGTQDLRQLRELLARSNPEIIMPLKGQSPLSQAVILTLVHRVRVFSSQLGDRLLMRRRAFSSLGRLVRVRRSTNRSSLRCGGCSALPRC
jgi:hypothetical protein